MARCKKGVKFPSNFLSVLLHRLKSDLFLLPKKHIHFCDFLPTLWLSTSRWHTYWPTFQPFLLMGRLVVVHFNFQVWDRNPDVQSKSAQKLAWKLDTIFYSVTKSLTYPHIIFLSVRFCYFKNPCHFYTYISDLNLDKE